MSDELYSIDDLEAQYTERALVNEATSKETLRKGDYVWTIQKITTRKAGEKSPFPGRRMIALQLVTQVGEKPFTFFQDVSFELVRQISVAGERVLVTPKDEGYDPTAPMDKPSKLWAMLEKIFNPDGDLSIAEVAKALPGATVGGYMMEGYAIPDSPGSPISWVETKPNQYGSPAEFEAAYDAERQKYMKEGKVGRNYLSNFHAVK